MKRQLELNEGDIEKAILAWLVAEGHLTSANNDVEIGLRTNGRAPEPDPPHAQESVRVWAVVTVRQP